MFSPQLFSSGAEPFRSTMNNTEQYQYINTLARPLQFGQRDWLDSKNIFKGRKNESGGPPRIR
jgi:hypothetical protein